MKLLRICPWVLFVAFLQLFAIACAPVATQNDDGNHGKIVAVVTGNDVTFLLEDTTRPFRTLQVAVALEGTRAEAVSAAVGRPYDVIEAGLGEQPADSFQLVVADTRRLPLTDGELASLRLQGAGTVSLGEAVAVTDEGERVTLMTEVR